MRGSQRKRGKRGKMPEVCRSVQARPEVVFFLFPLSVKLRILSVGLCVANRRR